MRKSRILNNKLFNVYARLIYFLKVAIVCSDNKLNFLHVYKMCECSESSYKVVTIIICKDLLKTV